MAAAIEQPAWGQVRISEALKLPVSGRHLITLNICRREPKVRFYRPATNVGGIDERSDWGILPHSMVAGVTAGQRRKRFLLKRTRAALQGKVPQPNDLRNRPRRGHVPGNFWRNIPCFGVQPPELARVLITTGRATKVFLFRGPSPGSAGTRTRTCSFSARRMRDGQHLPHIRG